MTAETTRVSQQVLPRSERQTILHRGKTSKAIYFDLQASITLHVLFAEKEQEWIVKESANNKSRQKVSLGNLIFSCCAFILYPMFQKI